ncbi:YitT family protein [Treponema pedis]|uniref:YitT family protein n=1 Tax=Treponema pedis TaxID=409322 RepID=A0A7S6WPZ8_9SPIR|nr:YitT family protein [Treponema pedis]QOW61208.1 YitT family protein [Treponema pedis]QSI04458.1 YitT family protein [Treponema pedis]
MNKNLSTKFILGILFDLFLVTLGSVIAAAALQFFLIPGTIAPGGVSGLSVAIEKLTGIKVYILNLVINIPLFILGAKLLGKKSAIFTLYSLFVLSGVLAVLPQNYVFTDDLFLAAIFGGILLGLGLGIVFKAGGTTGGTDLAGAIVHDKWPGLSIAKGMAIADFVIVAFAGIVDKNVNTSLYSLIALFFCTKIADMVLDGFTYFKGFFIISSKPEEVGNALMQNLERGVTILNGAGMYSKQERPVLLCVVSRAQFMRAKDIITEIDGNAFIMVCDMREVFGLGFKK